MYHGHFKFYQLFISPANTATLPRYRIPRARTATFFLAGRPPRSFRLEGYSVPGELSLTSRTQFEYDYENFRPFHLLRDINEYLMMIPGLIMRFLTL
jgi:hypothetical protein